MPFLTTAAVVGGALAAGGSVAGAAINAHAAGKAADAQAGAAMSAQQLQAKEAKDALDFQKQQWTTDQQNMAPWLSAGKGGLSQLQQLLGIGTDNGTGNFGTLSKGWTGGNFQAPTDVTEQNDPGYKFRLQQGEEALQNSAAARGGLLSGNTAKALNDYAQGTASSEYGNVYGRALNTFNTNYGLWSNDQTNSFNRLGALAGVGQQAATTLGQQGQQASNNVSNVNMTSGAQQGQDLNNAGAARASGYVGGANAWGQGIGGATNSLSNLMMLQQFYGGGFGNGAKYLPGGSKYAAPQASTSDLSNQWIT